MTNERLEQIVKHGRAVASPEYRGLWKHQWLYGVVADLAEEVLRLRAASDGEKR